MRIVLLGGTGQIGWELRRALAPLGDVLALERSGDDEVSADLERPEPLRRALRRSRPDVIVNAAAYTDVDRAETEPERAARINAEGPRILASEAKRLDAWLVHYSTDYVFDGSGDRPWAEDDAAAPLSVYGRTKWEGEEAVRASGCKFLLLRTQWIYSARRRNFVSSMLRAAAERDTLEVVDDQTGAPTGADLVADVTAHVLRAVRVGAPAGTYHVAARGETTRCGYARFVVQRARRAGWPLELDERAIVPIASDERPTPARRPLNCRLRVDRLERTFGLRMPDWRPGVERVIAELDERRRAGVRPDLEGRA
ncbi:MAG TPA: dTDP-4-dehydrorhamnose reductase [Gammaproteobacteria bacterium]